MGKRGDQIRLPDQCNFVVIFDRAAVFNRLLEDLGMEAAFELERNLTGDCEDGVRCGGLDSESGKIDVQGRVGDGYDIDVIFRPGFFSREGKTGPEDIGRIDGWDIEG